MFRLFDWQKKAIEIASNRDNFAIFADMGTGKTCTMVHALMNKGADKKNVLIVSPLVTLYNWASELEKFAGYKDNVILIEKMSDLDRAHDLISRGLKRIILINYEKISQRSNKSVIAFCKLHFDILILDESHYVKNPRANRTKMLIKLAQNCKERFLMTGTPVLKNMMDLWSQFMILDSGASLGDSYHVFLFKYFYDKNAYRRGKPGYFPDYHPREESKDVIRDILAEKSIVVKKSECLDLPPLMKEKRMLPLKGKTLTQYMQMKKDFVTFVEGEAVTASMAMVKLLRLNQICSGFLPVEDSEEEYALLDSNPKLDMLKEELENFDFENEKMIIWTTYKAEIDIIKSYLEQTGRSYSMLTGSMNAKEKASNIELFEKVSGCRIMLANQRAGGIGVNLTAASTAIYYSRSFDLAVDLQSEARNYRSGSEKHKTITRIDLVVKDTVDEVILQSLHDKNTSAKELIQAAKK